MNRGRACRIGGKAAFIAWTIGIGLAGCWGANFDELAYNSFSAAGRTSIDLLLTELMNQAADAIDDDELPDDGGGGDDLDPCPTGAATGQSVVSYSLEIQPIFVSAGCLAATCHGGALASSSYDMRTWEATFVRGAQARFSDVCPIVPGDPAASYLIEKLLPNPRLGKQMPNDRPVLTQEQIDLITAWILDGAPNN